MFLLDIPQAGYGLDTPSAICQNAHAEPLWGRTVARHAEADASSER